MTKPTPSNARPRLVIAGASGFIGTAACRELAADYDIIALTRSHARSTTADPDIPITWRHCDLFSMRQVEAALEAADYVLYLVHSMLPSSRLTQAKPEDMDLLIADNVARGAARQGVKQILFVGGVVPEGFEISRLLWSRREVEMTLGSHGTPVTALRANLVVGAGGTSLRLLVNLVRRLPLLPLPRAAHSRTQPIALRDVLKAIRHCLGNSDTYGQHFDIGGPEVLTFAEILQETAAVLGVRRLVFTVPFLPLALTVPFVRLFSGASSALVNALVESLPQDTAIRDNPVQRAIQAGALPYRQALAAALDPVHKTFLPSPRLVTRDHDATAIREASVVRSIQRIILPPGQNAAWVAGNYFRWLPRFLWPLVDCQFDAIGSCAVCIRFPRVCLLTLTFKPKHSTPDRQLYFITAGSLARRDSELQGRFEFRDVLNGRYTIAAIHDFPPALPWYFYIMTQALTHSFVMRTYQRRLARLAR